MKLYYNPTEDGKYHFHNKGKLLCTGKEPIDSFLWEYVTDKFDSFARSRFMCKRCLLKGAKSENRK